MRKILFIILLFVIVSADAPQPQYSFTWLRAQDITNTRYFIWQGDTVDFDSFSNKIDSTVFEDNYLKFYSNGEILDSAYWDHYQDVDTFRITGNYIQLRITEENTSHYIDISSLLSKMDTVAIDSTLTGNGTETSPLGIDESILKNAMKTNYTITLPSAGSVGNRITGAIEGTDYPTGWVLQEVNGVDLQITHNLGRRVAYVTVWSISGTQHQQLFGNSAYSGIFTPDENSLKIQALATITADITIQIVFAE